MPSFSDRLGFSSPKKFQTDSVDSDLGNRMMNATLKYFFQGQNVASVQQLAYPHGQIFRKVWSDFFKQRLELMPSGIREYILTITDRFHSSLLWYEKYNFLEFLVDAGSYESVESKSTIQLFIKECNSVFEEESSGFRFVGKIICPVTNPLEVSSLEKVLTYDGQYKNVSYHFNSAMALFSDKKNPDFRNAIKDAISAVESLIQIIAGLPKATLGDALNNLARQGGIHPALKQAFSALYGFASEAHGIRHAKHDEEEVQMEDALLILVLCSGFINFMVAKNENRAPLSNSDLDNDEILK